MTNKQREVLRQQHTLLAQFIIRLSLFYQGYSKAIDEELTTLRSHLGGAANFALAHVSINKLTALIQDEDLSLRQCKSKSLKSVENAAKALLARADSNEVSDAPLVKIVSQARQSSASMFDVLQLCLQTLDIYSKALDESTKQATDVDDKQPAAAPHEIASPEKLLLYLQEELSQLLTTYLAKQPDNYQLNELQDKVAGGLSNDELLNVCLSILRLVVKDSMQEATFSGKVIQSLHQSLGNIHEGLNNSLDQTHHTFDAQRESAKAVRDKITKIEKDVASSESIASLRDHTQAQLKQVGDVLQQRENEDREAQRKLTQQLEKMKEQVTDLEAKTRFYRNKLARQTAISQVDPLTRLPNRQAYNDHLDKFLSNAKQDRGSLCLAVMDIDHFKSINDRFGHAAGDKTLQVVAKHLRQALDTDDFIARWGGEEFVLVLPSTAPDVLKQKLESLRTRLTEIPFKFKQERLTVTASFGGTRFSSGETPDDVFERADKLLYQAKRAGRNCVVIDQDDVK